MLASNYIIRNEYSKAEGYFEIGDEHVLLMVNDYLFNYKKLDETICVLAEVALNTKNVTAKYRITINGEENLWI